MATIKDVAHYANVSVTTISNFLNNKKNVKDYTRLKIIEAIKVTGYRFNPLTASLKRKSTGLKTIGIISMVYEGAFFRNFFSSLSQQHTIVAMLFFLVFNEKKMPILKHILSLCMSELMVKY